MERANIDWTYSGEVDGFIGTGATAAERALAIGFAVLVTLGLVGFLRLEGNPAAFGWRLLLLLILVSDIMGGVVANMLNSCKRMYHAPLQAEETGFIKLAKNPVAFALLHIHPIVFAAAFFTEIWIGIVWYVALVLSVILTLATPLYLRRPVAAALVVIATLVSLYGLPFAAGFEWFIPCLFFKIVLAHAVREEPYRPAEASA